MVQVAHVTGFRHHLLCRVKDSVRCAQASLSSQYSFYTAHSMRNSSLFARGQDSPLVPAVIIDDGSSQEAIASRGQHISYLDS